MNSPGTEQQKSPQSSRSKALKSFTYFFLAPLALLLSLVGWALSSPAGSSPDEVFHVASIWCAQGEQEDICEPGASDLERQIPSSIIEMSCFAFQPEITGACQHRVFEIDSSNLSPIQHGNWNGQVYPPLFYSTLSMFVSPDVSSSILAIRLFNALLVTAMLSITFFALPRENRPILALSAVLSFVPLGMFLFASANPSSWALLSAAIVFPILHSIDLVEGRRRLVLTSVLGVGIAIGLGSRADSAIYICLAAVVACLLSKKRSKYLLVILLVAALVSVVTFFSFGQSSALDGLDDGGPTAGGGMGLLWNNLTQLPTLWLGMYTNLGWLDTAISPSALFAFIFGALGLLFTSIRSAGPRELVSLATVAGALVVIPLYMLQASGATVGAQVQPRYLLPIFVILLATACVALKSQPTLSKVQLVIIASLVTCGHALALLDQIKRYTGSDNLLNPAKDSWWWDIAPAGPLVIWAIAAAAFGAMIILLTFSSHRTRVDAESLEVQAQ